MTQPEFESHFPEIACQRIQRCPSWVTLEVEQGCQEDVVKALNASTIVFEPTLAADCLTALADEDCEEPGIYWVHPACMPLEILPAL